MQPGFRDPSQLQTLRVFIPEAQVKEPERVIAMLQEIERKISSIPGVSSVAMANSVPTDGNNSTDLLYAEDRTYREGQLPPLRRFKFVAPGFFQTMGTRLVAGRDFNWTEINDRRPVAIVSENMAREMWHDPRAALGKRIREGMNDPWREIVGVTEDVRHDGPDQKAPTTVYWPVLMKNFWGNEIQVQRGVAYAIRSSRAGSESFLKEVREAVWSVNRELPLGSHPHHGRGLPRIDGAEFVYAGDARHRGRDGAVAGRGGDLRRNFLFGIAADTGDWHSYRSRCTADGTESDGCAEWHGDGGNWRGAGSHGGCGTDAIYVVLLVRDQPGRSGNVFRRIGGFACGRGDSELHTGA